MPSKRVLFIVLYVFTVTVLVSACTLHPSTEDNIDSDYLSERGGDVNKNTVKEDNNENKTLHNLTDYNKDESKSYTQKGEDYSENNEAKEAKKDNDLSTDENKNGSVEKDEQPNYFFIKPVDEHQTVCLKVYKEDRMLEVYFDSKLSGRFKIALGKKPFGDKEKEGDKKTPEGNYYVCTKNPNSNFTLSLGISYPNIEDAKRGLEKGVINNQTYKRIERAINNRRRPPWDTALGGEICIHGGGSETDWTLGCIALSDQDIIKLYDYIPNGTQVIIYP